tara:strand:+ start:37888 stop:38373 length:486 start_codon:yes stop_codon:yes gene_type:complete
MPKFTELTGTAVLSNTDLFVAATNTAGVAVTNSVTLATLLSTVRSDLSSSSADQHFAHVKFTVSTSSNNAYNFAGGGAVGSNNETLYLYRGFTYAFDVSGADQGNTHNFALRVEDGGADYTLGVGNSTGNVITWTVPQSLSSNIVYQCATHPAMVGTLSIV